MTAPMTREELPDSTVANRRLSQISAAAERIKHYASVDKADRCADEADFILRLVEDVLRLEVEA